MSEVDWKKFWQTYRASEVKSEQDLYFEVGKTINKEPISEEALKYSIQLVARDCSYSVTIDCWSSVAGMA